MGVMTTVGLAALVAGTITSVRGQLKAGGEAKKIGAYNAALAEQQATDAELRANEEIGAFRRQVRGLIGAQRTAYAGQDVDVSLGAPVAVQADTELLAARDMERVRRNAEREAAGFRGEAEVYRLGGQAAQSAARWGAASTLLGGTAETSLLISRYWPKKKGVPPPPTVINQGPSR